MNNKTITAYVRPEMTVFRGYSACKSPEVIAKKLGIPECDVVKLDANENNYGPSPRVSKALSGYTNYHIYPDAAQTELRHELERYTGMPADQIVAGSGSDQLIELLIKLFATHGDEIITMGPSFPMYRFYAILAGAKVVDVPRNEDFYIDLDKIKSVVTDKTKLIFLANPNNPTGTLTSSADVRALAQIGVPLVVDEAYYEFTNETAVALMSEFDNVMILRTFSKWSGLAGLRIGYGIFPPAIAGYLHAIRDPYNVNITALTAIKESFCDLDYLMSNVREIISERERLIARLNEVSWLKVYPSRANFILCYLLQGDASAVQQKLEDRGILVRCYADDVIKNCIRISIGKPDENDKLFDALNGIWG